MRYFLPTIVLTLAVTIISGCTTMSEKDYKLAKAVMAESPTVRAEVMNECVANLNREPKSEQKFMSDYLKIPQSKSHRKCFRQVLLLYLLGISAHRRDDKLRAILDAARPAGCYRLRLGVEFERVRAVLVEVAEVPTFPAAEGMVSNRHIDADHAS